MRAALTSLVCALVAIAAAACEPDVTVGPPPNRGGTGPGQQNAADAGGPDAAARLFRDDDFVESEASRDPFRSYVRLFKVHPPAAPQRRVIMPTTGVEEMRLVAIVSGIASPRAMLLDGAGTGYTVERGDFVGRPEVVQAGGGGGEGMAVTLNWRVDRIRPNEVVLTREDPTAPNRPPLTRIIPLHTEDEDATPTPRPQTPAPAPAPAPAPPPR